MQLISRLTRVPLMREGMADVPGVKRIKNREGLEWQEFNGDSIDIPPIVKSELTNIMSDFQSKFHEFAGGNENTRMIWAYCTKDSAIQQAHLQALEQSDDPRKGQFLSIIEWMNKFGARLWMSPGSIERYIQQSGQKVQNSSNTSQKWLEQFGYIWGLKKKGDYRNKRDAKDISDEHVEVIKNDTAQLEQMEQSGQKIMQVVTAQKNGAWGIFFTDGHNIVPVIGEDYYNSSKTNEHSNDWVEWDTFRDESGQHSKYFGVKSTQPDGNVKKQFVYPTSTQFLLPEGEQDSNPKVVSKAEIKNTSSQGQPIYYLWIKNDGTLWWVPKEARNDIAGKERKGKKRDGSTSGKPFPLTKEQVDAMNLLKDKHVKITKPHAMVYSWDTLPEQEPEDKEIKQKKMQDWQEKTHLMNQMYDFFSEHPQLPPMDVRLQATKYVIVGPQFKKGENTGSQETMGRMKSHHTLIEDVTPGSEDHYAVRKGWVIVGGEFNAARAEARGERGLAPAQSIDGMGPLTPRATVYEAINDAFSSWKINVPKPPADELQSAQSAFDAAHGQIALQPKKQNAIPTLTDQDTRQFGNPPQKQMPFHTPQSQQTPTVVRPQSISPTTPTQQVMPKKNEELSVAMQKQVMLKDASSVIRNFKRLG